MVNRSMDVSPLLLESPAGRVRGRLILLSPILIVGLGQLVRADRRPTVALARTNLLSLTVATLLDLYVPGPPV